MPDVLKRNPVCNPDNVARSDTDWNCKRIYSRPRSTNPIVWVVLAVEYAQSCCNSPIEYPGLASASHNTRLLHRDCRLAAGV